jgi:hypothetical protein
MLIDYPFNSFTITFIRGPTCRYFLIIHPLPHRTGLLPDLLVPIPHAPVLLPHALRRVPCLHPLVALHLLAPAPGPAVASSLRISPHRQPIFDPSSPPPTKVLVAAAGRTSSASTASPVKPRSMPSAKPAGVPRYPYGRWPARLPRDCAGRQNPPSPTRPSSPVAPRPTTSIRGGSDHDL